MPANKGPIFPPTREKTANGNGLLGATTKKKKQRVCAKNKKHCRQYLQLHSEYRSTYTWHEYTGPHQEHTVVRRAPQAPPTSTKQASAKLQSAKSTEDDQSEGPTLEPPLPRRKKCPELAYRHHEFINAPEKDGLDCVDTNVVADKVREVTGSTALPASQLSKAISRISTEYRLQFAWPRRAQLTNGEVAPVAAAGGAGGPAGGPPRKSLSMGALKQGIAPSGPAPVHKKRGDVDHKRDGVQASELEPLVGNNIDNVDGVIAESEEREEDLSELKVTFRSATKEEKDKENTRKVAPVTNAMPPAGRPSSVQARPIYEILQDDFKMDNEKIIARARKEFLIRHHLDRTTGIGDGALLPSPTREKLEPVVPRRRDESKETRDEIQPRTKSSPKSSPRTGRSQSLGPITRSPKRQTPRAPSVSKDAKEKEKEHKDKDARDRSGEPERHPRPTFLATAPPHRPHHAKPSVSNAVKAPLVKHSNQRSADGSGYGTGPISARSARSASPAAASGSKSERVKRTQAQNRARASAKVTCAPADPSKSSSDNRYQSYRANAALQAMTAEPQVNGDGTGGDSSVATTPLSQSATVSAPAATAVITSSPWFDDEPVVKSPPEPTRVKSPEQMIMRSPEPVNWTVPLDTGKTFTVTQNVMEGEPMTRPHSEAKTWAASSTVHSTPQSAPPELAALHKSHQHSGYKSPESESVSLGSYNGLNGHKDTSERDSPLPSNVLNTPTPTQSDKGSIATKEDVPESSIKPVAGTNLRCLEDPVFEFEKGHQAEQPVTTSAATTTAPTATQAGYRVLEAEDPPLHAPGTAGYHVLEAPALSPGSAQRSVATDVLEKARNRFDKFWGKGSDSQA